MDKLVFRSLASAATLASVVRGHGVILNAQGIAESPSSIGFGVDEAIARNCSMIAPCQLDTTVIRETEIEKNTVNLCGRTQLLGNIDIAMHTENALAAGKVTQVRAGGVIKMTLHQVNADGAGPYACDIDEGSNSSIMEKQLEMLNNVPGINGLSQVVAQDFNVTIKLPDDVRCTGGSTGNICTVRCRNNAIAGPFGGCFPIQQIDVEPTINTPQNIKSFKDLPDVLSQIDGNLRDLDESIKALAKEGSAEVKDNQEAGHALLRASAISKQFPTTTQLAPTNAAASPTSTAAISSRKRGKKTTRSRQRTSPSSAAATTTASSSSDASTTASTTATTTSTAAPASTPAASASSPALSSSLVLKPFRA